MKRILIFFGLIALLGCKKRLDDFLFNNDSSIEAYYLDDYTGTTTLDVGTEYDVADSMIHFIQFPISDNGQTLMMEGIYVGDLASIATDTVILYCHGTAKHMDFYWPRQKLYANLGSKHRFGVLMLDYPGYGLSDGTPTEDNMYASVGGAMQWLKDKGLTNERLVMFGFSLGSAPVCEIAARPLAYPMSPAKIILEAPFASAEVMIQDAAVLSLPGSYFVNVKIDNAEEIKEVAQPLLWIHGEDDHFLSMESHGQLVYNNHSGIWKKAVTVPGGDHENTPFVMGYSAYLDSILSFITTP